LLYAPGPTEMSILWRHNDLLCKCRVDKLARGKQTVAVDVKTTADASPAAFAWSVRNYGYDRQAAFYLRGLDAAGIACDGFAFIAVESAPPHAVAVYTIDDADLIEADAELFHPEDGLVVRYAACVNSGEWPGYAKGMNVLRLPSKRKASLVEL
jgi:hypothetical protein